MRRFASTLVAAAATLVALTSAGGAAPVDAAAVAYRADLWMFYSQSAVWDWRDNLTIALTSDLADAFGTATSAVTIKDCVVLDGTTTNTSIVFTVDGGSDTTFLASPRETPAAWGTAVSVLLEELYALSSREAAAAAIDPYFSAAWVNNVERLGSPDALPKTRFFEVTLHGKHLRTAMQSGDWDNSLFLDLAEAFGITTFTAMSHVAISRTNSSGVNNSVLTVWFSVLPIVDIAVNTTAFFAVADGTAASWLWRCANVHFTAAYADLGIPLTSRGAAALDDLSAETALTVTGTSVAPGDQAYTNAPTNAPVTNAPGGFAAGVSAGAFAVAAAALIGTSMALF